MPKLYVLIAAATLLSGTAAADTLQMDGTENAARFDAPGKPTRGMTEASVESAYGRPNSKQPAVGDRERDPVHRAHGAEALAHALDDDGGHYL